MLTFEQLQAEFLQKWAHKEGATTQTLEDLKSAFERFKGLLKYRGFTGDFSRIDPSVVDHFCEILEGKGIARVDLEHIRGVMQQFVDFARERSTVQPPPGDKAKAGEKQEKAASRPRRRVTMRLGLLIIVDVIFIAAVVYFLYVTPHLNSGQQKTLIAILVVSVLILVMALYRMISARL